MIVTANDISINYEIIGDGENQGNLAQKAIIGSELMILPSGHAAVIETPDKFNVATIKFIRKCEAERM